MHVMILAILYGNAGTETHLLKLCEVLKAKGHSITLVCPYANRSVRLVQKVDELGIKRLSTPFDGNQKYYRLSTISALFLWTFYLIRHRADVILTLELSWFLYFIRFFLKPGGIVIYRRVGLLVNTNTILPKYTVRLIDGVITETQMQSDAFLMRIPGIPTKELPCLGNMPRTIPDRVVGSKNDDGKVCVAFLGRYSKQKGVFRLLDIFPILKHRNRIKLNYYGYGNLVKLELQTLIKKRGLQKQINIHDGWTSSSELEKILLNTDLVVLPTEAEGLPIVLRESMAYGVPFVATNVGAVSVYSYDNPDVRIVPLDNNAIAHAIGSSPKSSVKVWTARRGLTDFALWRGRFLINRRIQTQLPT